MRKHLISFAKSPIGYLANLLATLATKLPRKVEDRFFGEWLCGICEAFCVKDGVQDDPLF